MLGKLPICPHCGAALSLVRDAFCSECRNPLDEAPQPKGVRSGDPADETSASAPALGPPALLMPFNAAAFVIVAVSYLPALAICHLLGDDRDGLKLVIGGPLALAIDLGYRLYSGTQRLLRPSCGGKFLWLPLWVVAVFWIVYGVWKLLG